MSALSRQLESIQNDRLRQAAPPSYLYDSRQAANLSNEDVYHSAVNAYTQLLLKETRLERYREVLVSEKSQQCDRALLNAGDDEKLSHAIQSACLLLGPFVLDKDCAYVLEWLVRRFRVHEYNVAAILALFMPYHETPQFAQMLQILKIEAFPQFHCLIPVKKSLQILPRHTLIQYMATSINFMTFVVNAFPAALKRKSAHRAIIAFWTATLVSYLAHKKSLEQEESGLIFSATSPGLLARSVPEAQLAAYIVLTQLSSKVSLDEKALHWCISNIVSKSSAASIEAERLANDEAALTTIVSICQRQEELESLAEADVSILVSRDSTASILASLASDHEISHFMRPLFHTLIRNATADEEARTFLQEMLANAATESFMRQQFYQCFLEKAIPFMLSEQDIVRHHSILQMLEQIRQADSELFQSVIQRHESDPTMSQLLQLILASSSSLNAVGIGIRSAEAQMRLANFKSMLNSEDDQPAREDFRLLLVDPAPEIAALLHPDLLPVLRKHLTEDEIVKHSLSMCLRDDLSRATLTSHLKLLSSMTDHSSTTIKGLWNRLLISKSSRKTVVAIWSSLDQTFKKDCILKGIIIPQEFSSRSNWEIAKQLAANIGRSPKAAEWLEFLQETLETSLLSCLVLCSYLKHLKKSFRIPSDILLRFSAAYVDVDPSVGLLADGAPTQEVLDTLYGKPKSPKSLQRIHATLFMAAVMALNPPKDAAWNWLRAEEATDLVKYRQTVVTVFRAIHQVTHDEFRVTVTTELFSRLLGEDVFSFLAFVWLQNEEMRLSALQDTSALLDALKEAATPQDFQLMVPSLFFVFIHGKRDEKEIAILILQHISKMLQTDGLAEYASSQWYGTDSDQVAMISPEHTRIYLAELLTSPITLLQPNGITLAHSSLGHTVKSKKQATRFVQDVFKSIMSHLTLSKSTSITSSIITAFSEFQQTTTIDVVQALLEVKRLNSILCFVPEQSKTQLSELLARNLALIPSHALQNAHNKVFENLLNALASESGDVQSFGLMAIVDIFPSLSPKQKLSAFNAILDLLPSIAAVRAVRKIELDSDTFVAIMMSFSSGLQSSSGEQEGAKRVKITHASPTMLRKTRPEVLFHFIDSADFTNLTCSPAVVAAILTLLGSIVAQSDGLINDAHTIMLRLVQALSAVLDHSIEPTGEWASTKIAPLLEVIKISSSTQLSNQGLLLVAKLTKIVPSQVILHMMPILTFMGASVFQRDDTGSKRVIDSIINGIMPALADSLRAINATELKMQDAIKPVIRTFVDSIVHVPAHRRIPILTQVVQALNPQVSLPLLLLELLSTSFSPVNNVDGVDLALNISRSCDAADMLAAMVQLVDDLNETSSKVDVIKATHIFAFIVAVLDTKELAAKIDSAQSRGDHRYAGHLANLIKQTVLAQSRHDELQTDADGLIYLAARLISLSALGGVVIWLFSLNQSQATIKAFKLLATRSSSLKSEKRNLLQPAIAVAYKRAIDVLRSESVESCAPVAETLCLIAKDASTDEHPALSNIFDAYLTIQGQFVESLQLLAQFELILKTRVVSSANRIIMLVRDVIFDNSSSSLRISAAVQMLQNLVIGLGGLSSQFLPEVLMLLIQLPSTVPNVQVNSLKRQVVKNTPITTMYSAVERMLDLKDSPVAIGTLQLLEISLETSSLDALMPCHKRIYNMLHIAMDSEMIGPANAARSCYVTLSLKLSEPAFLNAFKQTLDWAFTSNNSSAMRKTGVLRLALSLCEHLDSIFLPFFKWLQGPCVTILEDVFKGVESDDKLFAAVLHLLEGVCSLDDSDFWSRSRLSQVGQAVINCIGYVSARHNAAVQSSWNNVLVLVIQRGATDDTYTRSINTQLLHKTRSEPHLAWQALHELWSQASETMMPYISETVTYLIEALEHDSHLVVQDAQKLVKQIENVTGESLDEYLQ